MDRRRAVIFEEDLRIPEDAFTFEGFQRWTESEEFPETGRIDYLAGDIEVDRSLEDLFTHDAPKIAITTPCLYATSYTHLSCPERRCYFPP